MLSFDVITLFPEFVAAGARVGVLGRAIDSGILAVRAHQLRDYTGGSPHPVDDSPYGGGPGMVMRAEPIFAAVEDVAARHAPSRRILMTPQGRPFTQAEAQRLATDHEAMLIFCGRYEGVDERVRPLFDEELSIGDYVLTGGELGALVVIDAVSRLVPGVLGSAESSSSESFSDPSLLEYPQYTRPAVFRGAAVPSVLTSGNHAEIERWRREQSAARTQERRPDLRRRGS
jgi:tRNA (guanine37-N1)-methyltransferase